jgi:polysaccharide export outer membrane protein
MKKPVLFLPLLFLFLFSCVSKKEIEKSYQLFQTDLDSMSNYTYKELTIKEGDNLSIQVYTLASADQQQVALFNLPNTGTKANPGTSSTPASGGAYIVNTSGEIFLPKIGMYKVAGLTCSQLIEKLKTDWATYVKDIVVEVRLMGFNVNMLGEVRVPGVKSFTSGRATILDAIAAAGGLNDEAKRTDIKLVREENGKRTSYLLDLTSSKIYKSPVFQLQQNDLIYVGASDYKFASLKNSRFGTTLNPVSTITNLIFPLLSVAYFIVSLQR